MRQKRLYRVALCAFGETDRRVIGTHARTLRRDLIGPEITCNFSDYIRCRTQLWPSSIFDFFPPRTKSPYCKNSFLRNAVHVTQNEQSLAFAQYRCFCIFVSSKFLISSKTVRIPNAYDSRPVHIQRRLLILEVKKELRNCAISNTHLAQIRWTVQRVHRSFHLWTVFISYYGQSRFTFAFRPHAKPIRSYRPVL